MSKFPAIPAPGDASQEEILLALKEAVEILKSLQDSIYNTELRKGAEGDLLFTSNGEWVTTGGNLNFGASGFETSIPLKVSAAAQNPSLRFDTSTGTYQSDIQYRDTGTLKSLVRYDPDAHQYQIMDRDPSTVMAVRIDFDDEDVYIENGYTFGIFDSSNAESILVNHNGTDVDVTLSSGSSDIDIKSADALNIIDGCVSIKDGITAPSSVTGRAYIYVDSSDGDLKVIFGDGTTKTIVVDT